MVSEGTSLVTTLPAPTIGAFGNCNPAEDSSVGADRSALFDDGGYNLPVPASVWSKPGGCGRAGVRVIDEHHSVTNEHVVLDRNPLANETVTLDLAVLPTMLPFWISTNGPILVLSPIRQP